MHRRTSPPHSPAAALRRRARRARRLAPLAVLFAAVAARAADPLAVVREFCRADGVGARLHPRTWNEIAPLVAWSLEPAWDHVLVIKGYEVKEARVAAGVVVVDVQYTVAAGVRAGAIDRTEKIEPHTYRLTTTDGTAWRIAGPPPPPHVFETHADPDEMQARLAPTSGAYLSASAFVTKMLHDAGWVVPHLDVVDLPRASLLHRVESPQPADLVVYFAGEEPYHAGLADEEDQVVSATLNAGIRRTPLGAFAGEARFFRFGKPPEPRTSPPPATPPSS